jgi:hypothetical protein
MKVYVRSAGVQKALHAGEAIGKGQVIVKLAGKAIATPSRHSLQVGDNLHVRELGDFQFLNHSCSPNTKIANLTLSSLTDIAKDAELLFDYNSTEWELAAPFECECGSPQCCSVVRGYKHLTAAQRAQLQHPNPYLVDKLAQSKE